MPARVAKLAIRKRFKIVRRNPCGFDSRLRHINIMVFKRYKPRKVLVFDWSPNLAYTVGLIATDGCLSKKIWKKGFTCAIIPNILFPKFAMLNS